MTPRAPLCASPNASLTYPRNLPVCRTAPYRGTDPHIRQLSPSVCATTLRMTRSPPNTQNSGPRSCKTTTTSLTFPVHERYYPSASTTPRPQYQPYGRRSSSVRSDILPLQGRAIGSSGVLGREPLPLTHPALFIKKDGPLRLTVSTKPPRRISISSRLALVHWTVFARPASSPSSIFAAPTTRYA
jgi:hypothetical protein